MAVGSGDWLGNTITRGSNSSEIYESQQKNDTDKFSIHQDPLVSAGATASAVLSTSTERPLLMANNEAMPTESKSNNSTPVKLYIHVGPVKTGSSSIQCNLMVNPFLKESSYEYMGRTENVCGRSTFPQTKRRKDFMNLRALVYQYILRGWLKQDKFQGYVTDFKETFLKRFDSGIHTVFSAEEFCGLLDLDDADDDRLQLFADLLNSIPQSITFQVFDRHYFDWALSHYNFYEVFDKGKESSMHKNRMQSILEKAWLFDSTSIESQPDHPTCNPYRMWRFLQGKLIPLLDRGSLEVFNFHDENDTGDDLPTRYICNLPNSEVACHKSREKLRLDAARVTDIDVLHSDRIATAAWDMNLYSNRTGVQTQRKDVRKKIETFVKGNLNTTFANLPLECLSGADQNTALNISMLIGKEMLGDEFNVDLLRSKFSEKQAKNKFCSVNVTALLQEPQWIQFFWEI